MNTELKKPTHTSVVSLATEFDATRFSSRRSVACFDETNCTDSARILVVRPTVDDLNSRRRISSIQTVAIAVNLHSWSVVDSISRAVETAHRCLSSEVLEVRRRDGTSVIVLCTETNTLAIRCDHARVLSSALIFVIAEMTRVITAPISKTSGSFTSKILRETTPSICVRVVAPYHRLCIGVVDDVPSCVFEDGQGDFVKARIIGDNGRHDGVLPDAGFHVRASVALIFELNASESRAADVVFGGGESGGAAILLHGLSTASCGGSAVEEDG